MSREFGRRAYTAPPRPHRPMANSTTAKNQFLVRAVTIAPAKNVLTKKILVVEIGKRLVVCNVKHFLNGGLKVSG